MKISSRRVLSVCFLLILLISPPLSAQATTVEKEFGINAGYFRPFNEDFREEYGGILIGGELITWDKAASGWRFNIGYIRSSRKRVPIICVDFTGPCISDRYYTRMIIPLTVSRIGRMNWSFDGGAYTPYIAAGIGLYVFIDKDEHGSSNNYSYKGLPGINISCGATRDITEKLSFILDAGAFRTVGEKVPGVDGDVWGFAFSAGLRFRQQK